MRFIVRLGRTLGTITMRPGVWSTGDCSWAPRGEWARTVAIDLFRVGELRAHDTALFFDNQVGGCSRVSPGNKHPPDEPQWAYVRAVRKSSERSPCFEVVLQPGELWIINNRFKLHGRTAIKPDLRRRRGYYRVE